MSNGEDITIDDLARMVQKGFDEVTGHMARKDEVNERFDQVEVRLDRIEKFLLEEHRRRIERLEVEMKEVRDALAMK